MQIYSSLTREKSEFVPLTPGEIKFYVCGVTVYDYCHIGHARTFASFDTITRYMRHKGYKLTFVRNITDIDDKIIKRANELGVKWTALTEQFIEAMNEDFAALNILSPDIEPRATQTIEGIIAFVEKLIAKEAAYVAENGDVYFRISSFDDYGKLSKQDLDALNAGARVEVEEAKENKLDFVLWKSAKPEEPSWPSPWGEGRPGWHIECSAMSCDCLGETFDIHGGGSDLMFPHHENEIAQSEAAHDKTFARYWMHSGMVQVDQEKMSKSLGNFFTIRDVLKSYHPEVIRLFLISSHYRSQLNYCTQNLEQAKNSLERLYTALKCAQPNSGGQLVEPFKTEFEKAMDDDFNTPLALSVLFELAKNLNKVKEEGGSDLENLAYTLKTLANILGVLCSDPASYFQNASADEACEIDELLNQREKARADKDWAKADEIRDKLQAMNIVLEDCNGKTTWRKA